MSSSRIRVVVADDSPVVREILSALLTEDPGIEIAGTACDGLETIERVSALRPDVVTVDVGMPALDGLSAIDVIMERCPTRVVVVTAVDDAARKDLCFRALGSGALEVLAKPTGRSAADVDAWGAQLRQTVHLMAEVPVVRRPSTRLAVHPVAEGTFGVAKGRPVDAFGIVASTGGPQAVATILRSLPPSLSFPILVVQHTTPGFSGGLARWLAESTSLAVSLAADGDPCRPGCVYVAPDGWNLEVVAGSPTGVRIRLVSVDSDGHVPSGDRLLASLAAALGPRAGAIVLTGMGEDGAEGLLAVRKAGGVAWAQDEATSAVYGMPQAALRRGGAGAVVPLEAIASSICSCGQDRDKDVRGRRWWKP